MRLLIALPLLALFSLAACGPGEKMKYVCNIEWSCNGVTETRVERHCLDEDNPKLCEDLLEEMELTCEGEHFATNKSCICDGVTAHSCPADRD